MQITLVRTVIAVAAIATAWIVVMRRLQRQLTGSSHPVAIGGTRFGERRPSQRSLDALRMDGAVTGVALHGRDRAVDHERTPGVPPASALDDFDDIVDIEGAGSFPASDPPSGW